MGFPDDLMLDVAHVRPYLGESAYVPLFGEEFDEPCSMELGFKSLTDSKGKRVTASLAGIFRAECAIKIDDEITYDAQCYRAIMVAPMKMGGVVHHVEIDFVSVAK